MCYVQGEGTAIGRMAIHVMATTYGSNEKNATLLVV